MLESLPPYVLVARIGSVLGMSFSLAIGLLLLIGGLVVASLISFALFIPAFALMLLAERSAASRQTD